ncbi:hypothetical protein A8E81_27130 [Burkholderia cenocepacia]|nr:hypothetical protein A8E75_25655 [Burkholderia cenocepacia]ONV23638.1 hypothetical protein A8E77_30030 [Burkholderia cenocepacia]ONV23921.1 hypothetical protein A8E74_12550 [Burkholderia cenocepacia]ONV31920.1 hypothetical protein A8E78_15255 [Burkholderia cenocepacia]ONV47635.1 hypothetical protein A8E81_27130 [Burkholderia cenocepacia]
MTGRCCAHPVKPAPAKAGRGFSGLPRKTPTAGPHKPNSRLIRPSIHRESVVWPPAGAPRPGVRCLVTPL